LIRAKLWITGFSADIEQEAIPGTGIKAEISPEYFGWFAEIRAAVSEKFDVVFSYEHDAGILNTKVPAFWLTQSQWFHYDFTKLWVETREPLKTWPIYWTGGVNALAFQSNTWAPQSSGYWVEWNLTSFLPLHPNGSGIFLRVSGVAPIQGMKDPNGQWGKQFWSIMGGVKINF
jgi:hypothetical protein